MMVNIMALQSVIVCSDSMARGLDIDSVSNVVNYDVPVFAKTYVHRVGRTARAGREGSSYTLCKYIIHLHHVWNSDETHSLYCNAVLTFKTFPQWI